MSLSDKILPRKRDIAHGKSAVHEFKNICQIVHPKHLSFKNVIIKLISARIAYSYIPEKPAIQFEAVKSGQLVCFINPYIELTLNK